MKKIACMMLAVLAMAGCQKRYEKLYADMRVDAPAYVISAVDNALAIAVYYSYDWTASIDEGGEWMSIDKTSGSGVSTLHLTFEPNSGLSRVAFLRLEGGSSVKSVKITQRSAVALPRIEFEHAEVKVPAGSYAMSLPFDTNVPGKYFSGVPVKVVYEAGEGWVSGAAVIDGKESPLHREDMPDGVVRYLGAGLAANDGSQARKARLVVRLTDAADEEYADSVTVLQTSEQAYINASSKDVVNMPGGSREVLLTSNLGFASGDFALDVEYPDPSCTGFVTNLSLDGLLLKYDVTENNDNKVRQACINISYTDLAGTLSQAVQLVEQNCIPESFSDYKVYNADQLVAWNSSYAKWSDTDNITLCADIDMDGVSWIGHHFTGKFSGDGHRIYNLNVANQDTVAFFSSLSGGALLENVVFGSRDGISYDSHSSFSQTEVRADVSIFTGIVGKAEGNSIISGVTNYIPVMISSAPTKGSYCGALCGSWASGGELKDCRNYGSVSCTVCGTGSINIAGIAATVNGSGEIARCVNYATIESIINDTTGNTANIGGIAAYMPVAGSFVSCENRGKILVSGSFKRTKDTNAGGIISYPGTGADVSVKECYNYGDIVNESASATNMRLGGISSYVHADAKVIFAGCHNYGKISNSGECTHNSETGSLVMGGIVGLDAGVITVDKCVNEGQVEDTNSGTGNLYANLGGIVGRATNASTITACVNKAPIQRTNGTVKNIYAGGILGYSVTNALASFKDNDNQATAKILCASDIATGGTCHIAGIAGYSKVAIVIDNCNNAADVTASGAGDYSYFAGIIGRSEVSGNKILNCTNSGNVTNSGSNVRANGIRIGGIIGQSRYTEISGCTNTGNVVNTNTSVAVAHFIGGIMALNNNNVSKVTNCQIQGCRIASDASAGINMTLVCNTSVAGTVISGNTVKAGNTVGSVAVSASNFESLLVGGSQAAAAVRSGNKYEE